MRGRDLTSLLPLLEFAWQHVAFRSSTYTAVVVQLMNALLDENEQWIATTAEGKEELKALLRKVAQVRIRRRTVVRGSLSAEQRDGQTTFFGVCLLNAQRLAFELEQLRRQRPLEALVDSLLSVDPSALAQPVE